MTTDFQKLLREAVKVCDAYDKAEAQRKLSAKAFMRYALKKANTTPAKLDALEKAIEAPVMERCRQFRRNALRFLKEPFCTCFPTEPRKLTWLVHGSVDELYAELARVGSDIFELFALAVRDATRQFPEAFGSIEDIDQHEKRLKALAAERAELFAQIETSYTPADLQIGALDKRGNAPVTFAISGGEVPLGPQSGERLVNWLRSHPEALR